jgi:hypothetical protein
VGGGQQRFKFMDQTPSMVLAHRASPAAAQAAGPAAAPQNELTAIVNGFVTALAVEDVRFDLSIYGPFFKDIPRRLGKNEALDASVLAMTTAYPSLRTRQQTPEMLRCYTDALRALRDRLQDPATAGTAETMCAVWLVMITQVRNSIRGLPARLGRSDPCVGGRANLRGRS